MKQTYGLAVLVSVTVLATGYFVRDGLVKFRSYERSVEVKGLAERIVRSNEAKLSFRYLETGSTLAEVHSRVARSEKAIMDFLVKHKLDSKDFEKGSVSINDNQANSYGSNKAVERFTARGTFVVNSKDVNGLNAAREQSGDLVKAGVTLESAELSYFFTDLNGIKPAMLKEATANAREAAKSFAADADAVLGGIKEASQGLFSIAAPNSEYDAGGSLMKKVRVVTSVSYFLK